MKYHYIYRITHIPTGRFYIGKRIYSGKDWRNDPYMGSGTIIKNLLKAHPLIEFRKEVLCFCRDAEQLLKAEEAAVGTQYQDNPLCVNLCAGGAGVVGRVISEETRAKIGAAKKGQTHSEEAKAKMSKALKGRTHSEEARAKLSEALKGRTYSEETREKMSEGQKGKILSEETKAKISVAIKGKTKPPFSEEHRANLSAAKRAYWEKRRAEKALTEATE